MIMIEKVAQAIEHNLGTRYLDIGAADAVSLAKAAIGAMKEPTEEMIKAEGVHYDYSCHTCGGHREGYQLMIDAALGKSEP